MEVDASLDDDASLTKASSRRTWSAGEDRLLQQIVERYGPRHWSRIAEQMHSRTDWQCRERWQNHLGPQIKKTAWTTEEDTTITRAVEAMGQKWSQIKALLPGRTGHGIKNRYHSLRRQLSQLQDHNPTATMRMLTCGQPTMIGHVGGVTCGELVSAERAFVPVQPHSHAELGDGVLPVQQAVVANPGAFYLRPPAGLGQAQLMHGNPGAAHAYGWGGQSMGQVVAASAAPGMTAWCQSSLSPQYVTTDAVNAQHGGLQLQLQQQQQQQQQQLQQQQLQQQQLQQQQQQQLQLANPMAMLLPMGGGASGYAQGGLGMQHMAAMATPVHSEPVAVQLVSCLPAMGAAEPATGADAAARGGAAAMGASVGKGMPMVCASVLPRAALAQLPDEHLAATVRASLLDSARVVELRAALTSAARAHGTDALALDAEAEAVLAVSLAQAEAVRVDGSASLRDTVCALCARMLACAQLPQSHSARAPILLASLAELRSALLEGGGGGGGGVEAPVPSPRDPLELPDQAEATKRAAAADDGADGEACL